MFHSNRLQSEPSTLIRGLTKQLSPLIEWSRTRSIGSTFQDSICPALGVREFVNLSVLPCSRPPRGYFLASVSKSSPPPTHTTTVSRTSLGSQLYRAFTSRSFVTFTQCPHNGGALIRQKEILALLFLPGIVTNR